jgi:hypothetical protein
MRRGTGDFTKVSSVSSSKSRTSERRKYLSDGYRMHQTSVLGSCRAAEARKETAAAIRNQGESRSLVGSIGTHLDVSTRLDGTRTPGRHSLAPRFAFFGTASIPTVPSMPAKPLPQQSLRCLPGVVSFQHRDLWQIAVPDSACIIKGRIYSSKLRPPTQMATSTILWKNA